MNLNTDEETLWEDESDPLCSGCFAPLGELEDMCSQCGTPLSMSSTLDPLKMGFAEGKVYRVGIRRLAGIVVTGMWLIFFPSLLIGLCKLFDSMDLAFYFLIPGLLLLLFYSAVLFKATKNYFRVPPPMDDEME